MGFLNRYRDTKRKEQDLKDFLVYIAALEPIQIFGVAKLLGVDLEVFQKDEETEKGELLLELLIDKFCEQNKTRRRNLLGILKEFIDDELVGRTPAANASETVMESDAEELASTNNTTYNAANPQKSVMDSADGQNLRPAAVYVDKKEEGEN